MISYKDKANVNDSYTEPLTELHTIAQYDNGTADALYTSMRTIKSTLAIIKANSPSVTATYKSDTKEYRVTTKRGTKDEKENCAYYTNDSEDAIATARSIQVYCDENGL